MRHATQADRPISELARQWNSLHERAADLAKLASLAPERLTSDIADFPLRISEAGSDQRALAWLGMEDMTAMMRPGMTALHTLTERGQNTHVPALALWREFYAARASLLALA